VSFDVLLALRNPAGAKTFASKVSNPSSRLFHHYLTDAGWVTRFGPTRTALAKAESWLRSQGLRIRSVPKDRLFISASGTARAVERAFHVTLGYYVVNGHKVRLANGTLSIPSSLTGAVAGAVGVNEYLASNTLTLQGKAPAGRPANPAVSEPAPPAAFQNPQPCSDYWGQKTDTKDASSLYAPYTAPQSYDICGYSPAQLRGAYGLANSAADGTGVTIGIVDAYDSPTILADAQQYFQNNDHAHPLSSAQFIDSPPASTDLIRDCGGSGWLTEQALDVESSHAMAPGATIHYFGAQDCNDSNLLAAENSAITSGVAVVSNSWGDGLGDLFADASTHTAFDDTFLLAASTGVSILFSSGDSGDNFAATGLNIPNYPATSPLVTAVGGTTLEVNSSNQNSAEYGWSVARQTLCVSAKTDCGSATSPVGSLRFQSGGGGGTSYFYGQPSYQAGVVPNALALRNEALFGPQPLRVIPDISLDADAQSGMLIGLTEAFPQGNVHYGQFKEGGTSLASPLLAGVIADTDQVASSPLGFLNFELYQAYTQTPSAFNDIVAPANPNSAAIIRVDFRNTVDNSNGYVISLRAINYAGNETYCDATGNCATRPVTLTATPGFDSLTGLGSVGANFIADLAQF
jgi:subtilase family serine protease